MSEWNQLIRTSSHSVVSLLRARIANSSDPSSILQFRLNPSSQALQCCKALARILTLAVMGLHDSDYALILPLEAISGSSIVQHSPSPVGEPIRRRRALSRILHSLHLSILDSLPFLSRPHICIALWALAGQEIESLRLCIQFSMWSEAQALV